MRIRSDPTTLQRSIRVGPKPMCALCVVYSALTRAAASDTVGRCRSASSLAVEPDQAPSMQFSVRIASPGALSSERSEGSRSCLSAAQSQSVVDGYDRGFGGSVKFARPTLQSAQTRTGACSGRDRSAESRVVLRFRLVASAETVSRQRLQRLSPREDPERAANCKPVPLHGWLGPQRS